LSWSAEIEEVTTLLQLGKRLQELRKRQIVFISSKTLVKLWRGFWRVILLLRGSAKQKQ
jgi:hypothetical protein